MIICWVVDKQLGDRIFFFFLRRGIYVAVCFGSYGVI